MQCEWIVHKDADELLILQALFDTANVMAVFSEWSATVRVDDLLGLPCGPFAVSASSLHLTLPLLVLVLLLLVLLLVLWLLFCPYSLQVCA